MSNAVRRGDISVVVPAYNSASWIAETLQSVAAQTCGADVLEVIVVDDASTDHTAGVAADVIAAALPRGRLVRMPRNRGVSAARNVGLQEARGAWVQFLDADDLLAPGKLAAQHAVAATVAPDVAAVWSPWRLYDRAGDGWRQTGPLLSPDLGRDVLVGILNSFGLLGPLLFRRDAVAAAGGFSEGLKLCEDREMILRLVMAGQRLHRIDGPEAMFLYRQTPGNASGRLIKDTRALADYFDVLVRVERHWRDRQGGTLDTAQCSALVGSHQKYLRELYDGDPALYATTIENILALDPKFLPDGRPRARLVARVVGNSRAEWIGARKRQAEALLRRVAASLTFG